MCRLRPRLLPILALAVAVLLGAAAPSWGHTGRIVPSSSEAPGQSVDVSRATDVDLRPLSIWAAPGAPGLPWQALLGALLAVALGWRRPRRALALAVVLFLAVFAFEDALHSVHHLQDPKKAVTCVVAVAAAHLAAAVADGGVPSDVVLPAVVVAAETVQADPVTRFLRPDQGRAPPPPAV